VKEQAQKGWGSSKKGEVAEEAKEEAEVDMAVRPLKNRLVQFRGDAEHCVEAFTTTTVTKNTRPAAHRSNTTRTSTNTTPGATSSAPAATSRRKSGSVFSGRRVSLVLEQYRVPPGHLDFTTRFEIVDPKDYLRCYNEK
jgi:hypothetical protein